MENVKDLPVALDDDDNIVVTLSSRKRLVISPELEYVRIDGRNADEYRWVSECVAENGLVVIRIDEGIVLVEIPSDLLTYRGDLHADLAESPKDALMCVASFLSGCICNGVEGIRYAKDEVRRIGKWLGLSERDIEDALELLKRQMDEERKRLYEDEGYTAEEFEEDWRRA